MKFPTNYKCLDENIFSEGAYRLIPIRYEDQELIMQWRNEQIDILRQKELLTARLQKKYFEETVAELFTQSKPDQLLFSFLKEDQLIGYGGLVHINWQNQHAEISFLLDTQMNSENFYLIGFGIYLDLITQVALAAGLHKIYSYGYDVAAYRFVPLEMKGFEKEVVLKDHILIKEKLHDVKIYSKILNS
jgi:hypothetical protein